tara:strand:+ start:1653 stop:2063 length:411 start_codon:yes stop_codon:yes gene_type:complete
MKITRRQLRRIIREQIGKGGVPKEIQARIKNVADPIDREALEDGMAEVWAGERDLKDLENWLEDVEGAGGPEMMEAFLTESINKAIQDALAQQGPNSINAVIERVKALVGYQYDDDEIANAVEDHFDAASGGAGFM